jgi:catechol 2,3-dioxygenase-like lactoylglutathione lyase family enzyme
MTRRIGRRALAAAVVVLALAARPAFAAERPPIVGVSHIAFHVSDVAKARAFYGGLLGYEEAAPAAKPGDRLRFRINPRQSVEIVPGLVTGSDDRLDHVAFETTDLDALRAYLAEKDVKTSEAVMEAAHRMVRVTDPDGHAVEFVQYGPPSPKSPASIVDPRRISARLLHIGLTVRDQGAADRFYKDVLGFSEIWRGGRDDAHTDWINMKVPDGTDYLEYMLVGEGPVDRVRLGSLHHVALLVPDIQAALETVRARPGGWDGKTVRTPQVGRNRRWQLNLFDPDGSRTELMEPYTMR